ncbi:MAG TPA: AAA family ATPase [Acidimicrobiales bacterium]|nr:AAA family ATPase [Acidimicrobiales bacterium]
MAGGGRGGRREQLAGRREELLGIEPMLDALERGQPGGVLQVLGEPGIGKTRFLAEVGAGADERGHAVVAGRAADLEHDLPFGVFADALDAYLASLGHGLADRLGPELLAELATAFPSLAPLGAGHQPALQAERFRTHRAVRSLLEDLGRIRPTVVLLDDVHWADPASQELLAHLLAYPPDAPVLLVVAFRPAQTRGPLSRSLAAAGREGRAQVVELGPLSRAEADELMAPTMSPAARADVYRESGGNPFYLEQLVRVSSAHRRPFDDLSAGGGSLGAVPPAVQAALAAELESLPAPARALLEGAAVAGDPFEVDLGAAAAGFDEEEALGLVDTLVRLDLVRPTPVPRRFRFRHPIVRRAVYELSGLGWRIGAHARVATAMTSTGAPAAALAHHVERSAKVGDERAVTILVGAGDTTAARAPATAGHWYGAALRLLSDDDPRTVQLLVSRATALGAAGQLDHSHTALVEALDRLPSGRGELRVALTAFAAGVEMLMGRLKDAADRLLRALHDVGDQESIEAAALEVELAVLAFYSSDYADMKSWAEKAVATSNRWGYQPLEAVASALRAYAMVSMADPGADAAVTGAAALMDGVDDARLAQRIDAAVYLAWAESLAERFADSVRHVERGIAVSRAFGQGQFITLLTLGQSVALMYQGRISEARELAAAAVEAFRLGAPGYLLLWALMGYVWVSCYDDTERALTVARESSRLAQELEPTVITAASAMFLGMALLEAGQPAEARRALIRATAGPEIPRLGTTLLYDLLTRASLALGDIQEADEWARRAQERTHGEQLGLETSMALRARATVLLTTGDTAAAVDVALRAVARADGAGAPVEAARARLILGKALARAGRREQAETELRAAREVLAEAGAHRFATEAATVLRRLGHQGRRKQAGEGMASLSEREREIAELVAAGHSNREIAGICCVSVKTVERHLSNIFAKLGVGSRAALATLVTRQRAQSRA